MSKDTRKVIIVVLAACLYTVGLVAVVRYNDRCREVEYRDEGWTYSSHVWLHDMEIQGYAATEDSIIYNQKKCVR